jgi:hypothetical protein
MDDASSSTLDDSSNLSTIRQLTLGGYSRIKVHGDTKQIKSWIVFTSNEVPDFLKEDGADDPQSKAWRRRFISIPFNRKNMVDVDVEGNEFELESCKTIIAEYIYTTSIGLKKHPELYKTISTYCDNLHVYGVNDKGAYASQAAATNAADRGKKRLFQWDEGGDGTGEVTPKRAFVFSDTDDTPSDLLSAHSVARRDAERKLDELLEKETEPPTSEEVVPFSELLRAVQEAEKHV